MRFELEFGLSNSQRPAANRLALQTLIDEGFESLPFDESDARIAGRIRAYLKALGRPIGLYDLLIAAQALRTDSTLVTANAGEFARVPDLRLEDWSLSA